MAIKAHLEKLKIKFKNKRDGRLEKVRGELLPRLDKIPMRNFEIEADVIKSVQDIKDKNRLLNENPLAIWKVFNNLGY